MAQLRQLAIEQQSQGNLDQAIKLYNAVLQLAPGDISVWSNLGAALRKQKHYRSAVNCYRRALELQPNDATALGNLANALKDLHRLDESIAIHRQLIACKPDDIQGLMNYACALRENGQFAEALYQLDHAQTLAPDDAGVEWERAQNLLYLGRYSEGWKAYEARWKTGELTLPDLGTPQWRGEAITGKHILLYAEQGYGDTILAARYVKLVKERVGSAGIVTLQCKPELHRLFEAIGADHLITPTQAPGQIDLHCPLMSLMGCFDTQPNTIPPPAQLFVPEEARKKFAYLKALYPGKIKIGIVWSGSITFKNNDNRSLPLSAFLSLAEIPNVRLYSLQKGPRLSELKDSGAEAYIEDIGIRCDDFADTAAAIEHLDLIVMTDSSVAHLAASLDKAVVNIINKVPYWLYALNNHATPWYPSMHFVPRDNVSEGIKFRFCEMFETDAFNALRIKQISNAVQSRVINLDRRRDRWEQFCHINDHFSQAVRQSASDAQEIDVKALVTEGFLHESEVDANPAEVACALSHRAAWLEVISVGAPQLVMEDDVILRKDISDALPSLMEDAGSDWDFILLGYNTDSILDVEIASGLRMRSRFYQLDAQEQRWRVCGDMLPHADSFKRSANDSNLLRLKNAFGLGSYLISPKGAEKLLRNCFPLKKRSCFIPALGITIKSLALDVVLNNEYGRINAFFTMPPLVLPINDKSKSDIQLQSVHTAHKNNES